MDLKRAQFCLLLLALAACAPLPIVVAPQTPPQTQLFADHTASQFASPAAFDAFATGQNGTHAAKFVLPEFHRGAAGAVYLAPDFYRMHDEWYWFRLLNGQTEPGPVPDPLQGPAYATIADVYRSFAHAALPLELIWVEGRIYSTYFYTLALGDPEHNIRQAFAVGTLMHLPPDPRRPRPEELWLVMLEEQDLATEAELQEILRRLRQTLPADIAAKLRWLPHPSGSQDLSARVWQANGGALAGQIVQYADLAVPGQAEVYTPGLAAGWLYILAPGQLRNAELPADAIVVLSEIPDELPPVAAILTAVPQTPQAHLNLLAAARGTPNGYVAGIATDPVIKALAAARVPVVIELGAHGFRYKPWTDVALDRWQALRRPPVDPAVALTTAPMPDVVPLGDAPTTTGPAALPGLLPQVGGKAAGVAALFGQPGLTPPWRPMALTVNGYAQHVQPFAATWQALLASPEFVDPRARLLLLEGEAALLKPFHGDPEGGRWLAEFKAALHEPAVRQVLAADGVQHMIRAAPLDPRWLAGVRAQLEARFGALADDQPLRFRSSSTAEDVEGFNAAGIYSSHSGYLHAERLNGDARKHTIEKAIRNVWASFWSHDAWAERARAGVDQLAPRMAVLVEPSFPDPLEVANGVVLMGLGLDAQGAPTAELTVNVQPGALSVTNPPPGVHVVPEIDRVVRAADGRLQLTRIQAATTHPAAVLADAQLLQMFAALEGLAGRWLAARNARLPAGQKTLTTLLDLEFRLVADGWPKLRAGPPLPGRLVWKQVRPLSRAAVLQERDLGAPTPVDVRAAAQRVVRRVCTLPRLTVTSLLVWTHPSATLLPYAQTPLTVQTQLELLGHARPLTFTLDAAHDRLTWRQWSAVAAQAPAELVAALAALQRPADERLSATWPQLGTCQDTPVAAAPEQALQAWLDSR